MNKDILLFDAMIEAVEFTSISNHDKWKKMKVAIDMNRVECVEPVYSATIKHKMIRVVMYSSQVHVLFEDFDYFVNLWKSKTI